MNARAITITDLNDPRVDVYRNVRDADMRGRDGLFMAESELVLRRLIRTPQRLHSILVSPEKYRRIERELQQLPPVVPVYVAELPLMHEIAAFHIHRGVLAAGFRLSKDQLTIDAALREVFKLNSFTLIACEGVTNVDNMGAIFRNAAAFGVNGVILDSTCCDPLYRKAVRVSMGHVLSIPYAISENLPSDLALIRHRCEAQVIAAESGSGAVPLWRMRKSDRTIIVLGSEGHGVSRMVLDTCEAVCEVPMTGEVPSINVAVASAVALYELQRQRANDQP